MSAQSSTLVVTGYGSQIVRELARLIGNVEIKRMIAPNIEGHEADRFLFCAGLLQGRRINDNGLSSNSWIVNFKAVASACDRILDNNQNARICVIGSESGIVGSYDMAYAGAKAALHMYVENKRVPYRGQQIVCVAPNIIADAGMTTRRRDLDRLKERAERHPKGRFCTSVEVARAIRFLLYEDLGYINNVVIRMNGGEHARK